MSHESIKTNKIPKLEGTPKKIVCYGCSLLCDDVYVELGNNNELIRTVNSCFRGNNFLKAFSSESRLKTPIQKDMGLFLNLSMGETIDFLSKEFNDALSFKFYGLGSLTYESQISVMNFIKVLMEEKKEVYFENNFNFFNVLMKYGMNLTSIGQAINNADLFIFWKTDPTHSHPKLTGKLLFTRGFFRSAGKEGKKLILIEDKESDLTRLKDILIMDEKLSSVEIIAEITKLLNEKDVINHKFPGLNELNLENLQDYLVSTEFGVIVTDIPHDQEELNNWFSQMSNLLNILNKKANGRFSILPLSQITNELGKYLALLSTFSKDEIKLLTSKSKQSKEIDVAVIFGGEYLRDEYYNIDLEYPESKIILFDNFKSKVSKMAKITIPYALPGIEDTGTAIRFDNMNLSLIKWFELPEGIWPLIKIFNEVTQNL